MRASADQAPTVLRIPIDGWTPEVERTMAEAGLTDVVLYES